MPMNIPYFLVVYLYCSERFLKFKISVVFVLIKNLIFFTLLKKIIQKEEGKKLCHYRPILAIRTLTRSLWDTRKWVFWIVKDTQTDIRTLQLYDWIDRVGQFSENGPSYEEEQSKVFNRRTLCSFTKFS